MNISQWPCTCRAALAWKARPPLHWLSPLHVLLERVRVLCCRECFPASSSWRYLHRGGVLAIVQTERDSRQLCAAGSEAACCGEVLSTMLCLKSAPCSDCSGVVVSGADAAHSCQECAACWVLLLGTYAWPSLSTWTLELPVSIQAYALQMRLACTFRLNEHC